MSVALTGSLFSQGRGTSFLCIGGLERYAILPKLYCQFGNRRETHHDKYSSRQVKLPSFIVIIKICVVIQNDLNVFIYLLFYRNCCKVHCSAKSNECKE